MPLNNAFSVTVRSSFKKVLLIAIPHFIALLLLGLLVIDDLLNTSLVIVLLFLIIISFTYFSRAHLLMVNRKSVSEFRQDSAKNWLIKCNHMDGSNFITVNLMNSSFISNFLIILNFEDISKKLSNKYSVLITSDSLKVDDFRQLKVHLKLMKVLDENEHHKS